MGNIELFTTPNFTMMADQITLNNEPSQDLTAINEVMQNGPGKGYIAASHRLLLLPERCLS